MKSWTLVLLLGCLIALGTLVSCGDGGGDDDDDDDDSAGGPVDDDERAAPPAALVVTTREMAAAWEVFADWKDRTGLRCDVVAVEEIPGAAAGDAGPLRDYLREAHGRGVRYVLLGGDADQVPYLRGYTEVWALTDYYGTAPIQIYLEELYADWDLDQDGVPGEQGEDITVETLRGTQVAVGRVPVENAAEAQGFIEKLMRYESGEGLVAERAACPLFLADLAASVPLVGDIDGGMTHEQLIADYLPEHFRQNMRRLYGTPSYAAQVGAEVGTTENVVAALEDEGYALSVANSHGNFQNLTNTLDMRTVGDLTNEVPIVFFTTSCLSGNFADRAMGNGDNPPQGASDSVAEQLIKNPDGGAVAYVGNTLIGLGPLGGVQFNHSLCRAIFQEGDTILGDAMIKARHTLWQEVATVTVGELVVEFTMDLDLFPGTEWYTQRSTILLGDPSLRLWTRRPGVLTLSGPDRFEEGYNVIDAAALADGAPAEGITVTLSRYGGVLIRKTTDAAGAAQFRVNLAAGDRVHLTAYARDMTPAVVRLASP